MLSSSTNAVAVIVPSLKEPHVIVPAAILPLPSLFTSVETVLAFVALSTRSVSVSYTHLTLPTIYSV